MSSQEQALQASSGIACGFDSNKHIYGADNAEDLTLDDFIRSLCSDKRTAPVSVELSWHIGEWNSLFAATVSVRILIESVTQVYLCWYDPLPTEDSPGEWHVMDAPEWMFTGRLLNSDSPIDPAPDAEFIRVRGYIQVNQDSPEEIEGISLRIAQGLLSLPFSW